MPACVPRSRHLAPALVVLVALVVVVGLGACGRDDDDVAGVRAAQARAAALAAGLDEDVAEFLAMAARGETAEYRVTYPGARSGQELHIANRPPDRRVETVVDGTVVEVRMVIDGVAIRCGPGAGLDGGRCERTDVFVDPPGVFTDDAVAELTDALAERSTDFDFSVRTMPVAGIEATCLITSIRAGRERPELGEGGTICLAPSGALLLVDRDTDRLEAIEYRPGVDDDAFERPDDP